MIRCLFLHARKQFRSILLSEFVDTVGDCKLLCIVRKTKSCTVQRIGDTNFLVSCQTEWKEDAQNDMAVPTADDGFKPRDV